jgi:hypothetical protein
MGLKAYFGTNQGSRKTPILDQEAGLLQGVYLGFQHERRGDYLRVF